MAARRLVPIGTDQPTVRGRRREQLIAAAATGDEPDPGQAMLVRVVEYMIDNRAGGGELFCLITTLTATSSPPHSSSPRPTRNAGRSNYPSTKSKSTKPGVMGSAVPHPGIGEQEIWSLLLTHYAIRHVMKNAADTVGTDPDDLSFIRSYRAIRRRFPTGLAFPLTDSPTHSPKPSTRSSHHASVHGDNGHILGGREIP